MTPEQLKNSILQLAIEGKLVPQDKSEGTGTELLETLQSASLTAPLGRGAKKALPPVTPEEEPFAIPDNWCWCRLGEICKLVTKGTTPRNDTFHIVEKGIGFLRAENIAGLDKLDLTNMKYIDESTHTGFLSRSVIEDNDLLITIAGTLGRTALVKKEFLPLNCNQAVSIVRLVNSSLLSLQYLIFAINAPNIQSILVKQKKITAIPNLTLEIVQNTIIPLPPLAEQKRIVAKLEELLPLVEEYAEYYNQLQKLNQEFPGKLKKALLQFAIEGKLVPQDKSEGTGADLLKTLQSASLTAPLVRGAKKALPPVTPEEEPFAIPDNWCWCRLGEICKVNPRNKVEDDIEVGFIPMTLLNAGYGSSFAYERRNWKQVKSGFTHFADNDVVFAKITPCFQNMKSALMIDLPNGYGAGTTELHVLRCYGNEIYQKYLLYFVKTSYFINSGTAMFTGTAGQQRISSDFIVNFLVPLPPLAEQKRIVAKLEELLPLCESLESR